MAIRLVSKYSSGFSKYAIPQPSQDNVTLSQIAFRRFRSLSPGPNENVITQNQKRSYSQPAIEKTSLQFVSSPNNKLLASDLTQRGQQLFESSKRCQSARTYTSENVPYENEAVEDFAPAPPAKEDRRTEKSPPGTDVRYELDAARPRYERCNESEMYFDVYDYFRKLEARKNMSVCPHLQPRNLRPYGSSDSIHFPTQIKTSSVQYPGAMKIVRSEKVRTESASEQRRKYSSQKMQKKENPGKATPAKSISLVQNNAKIKTKPDIDNAEIEEKPVHVRKYAKYKTVLSKINANDVAECLKKSESKISKPLGKPYKKDKKDKKHLGKIKSTTVLKHSDPINIVKEDTLRKKVRPSTATCSRTKRDDKIKRDNVAQSKQRPVTSKYEKIEPKVPSMDIKLSVPIPSYSEIMATRLNLNKPSIFPSAILAGSRMKNTANKTEAQTRGFSTEPMRSSDETSKDTNTNQIDVVKSSTYNKMPIYQKNVLNNLLFRSYSCNTRICEEVKPPKRCEPMEPPERTDMDICLEKQPECIYCTSIKHVSKKKKLPRWKTPVCDEPVKNPLREGVGFLRLKKINIPEPEKICPCPDICKEIERSDKHWKLKIKPLRKIRERCCKPVLPVLSKGKPFKRLPPFKKPDPIRECPPCIVCYPMERADVNLRVERKTLPPMNPSPCPPITKPPPLKSVVLKRLPKVPVPEPERICPCPDPICPCSRADDGLRIKQKRLPPISLPCCEEIPKIPMRKGRPFRRLPPICIDEPIRPCEVIPPDECRPRSDLDDWLYPMCECPPLDNKKEKKARDRDDPNCKKDTSKKKVHCPLKCKVNYYHTEALRDNKTQPASPEVVTENSNHLSSNLQTLDGVLPNKPVGGVFRQLLGAMGIGAGNVFKQRYYSTFLCNRSLYSKKREKQRLLATFKTKKGKSSSKGKKKRCGKKKGGFGGKCSKHKADCCPKRVRFSCKRMPIDPMCTKQKTPYPAFSELRCFVPDAIYTECPETRTYLEPWRQIFSCTAHMTPPPPYITRIDPTKEDLCLRFKYNLPNPGNTLTCDNMSRKSKLLRCSDVPEAAMANRQDLVDILNNQDTKFFDYTSTITTPKIECPPPPSATEQCCKIRLEARAKKQGNRSIKRTVPATNKGGSLQMCPSDKKKKKGYTPPKTPKVVKTSKFEEEAFVTPDVSLPAEKFLKENFVPKDNYGIKINQSINKTYKTKARKSKKCTLPTPPQQQTFWEKLCNFFKARQGCPAPDEWKRKVLREEAIIAAKKAGLCLYDPNEEATHCKKKKVKRPNSLCGETARVCTNDATSQQNDVNSEILKRYNDCYQKCLQIKEAFTKETKKVCATCRSYKDMKRSFGTSCNVSITRKFSSWRNPFEFYNIEETEYISLPQNNQLCNCSNQIPGQQEYIDLDLLQNQLFKKLELKTLDIEDNSNSSYEYSALDALRNDIDGREVVASTVNNQLLLEEQDDDQLILNAIKDLCRKFEDISNGTKPNYDDINSTESALKELDELLELKILRSRN